MCVFGEQFSLPAPVVRHRWPGPAMMEEMEAEVRETLREILEEGGL